MKQNNILSLLPVATIFLPAASTLPLPGNSRVSDLEREQRLVEQTMDAIFVGAAHIRTGNRLPDRWERPCRNMTG